MVSFALSAGFCNTAQASYQRLPGVYGLWQHISVRPALQRILKEHYMQYASQQQAMPMHAVSEIYVPCQHACRMLRCPSGKENEKAT